MTHPVLEAGVAIDAALKTVADVAPVFMTTGEKAEALTTLVRLEARLAELRLRVMAAADDVAERDAARDAAAWLAHATRGRGDEARADLRLARALDERRPALARAVREGRANLAQARVVVRCLDDLPDDLCAEQVAEAEEVLTAHAETFDPRQLDALGRHLVDVVAPEVAEALEARRLARLESEGRRATRLSLRRLGDGTTRLAGVVPDAAAARLATYLEAFANPRRAAAASPGETDVDAPVRATHPQRLGEAFCRLLEVVDPKRLPVHGGDATTVVVTIPLEALQRELATAELLGGSVPGGDGVVALSAAEARRLACTARIVPAVLGGDGEVLDLGRGRRLFSAAQQRALVVRDRTCRAVGCDVPGTWAEAHHWLAWSLGGLTDLANAVLLCSHHHHLAHDPRFRAERLADGAVRFHRRT